jgi:hypothetical protein
MKLISSRVFLWCVVLLLSSIVASGCRSAEHGSVSQQHPAAPTPSASPRTDSSRPSTGTLINTRCFLPLSETLKAGYGFYTYILFPNHPTDALTRQRYREVLIAFLMLEAAREYSDDPARRRLLNLTVLPVWSRSLSSYPLPRSDARDLERFVENLVDREYRYSAAAVLLRELPEAEGPGPFIVSTDRPLSEAAPFRPGLYTVSNMSWLPSRLVRLWTVEYLRIVAKDREWNPGSYDVMVLNLRGYVGVAAEGFPEVLRLAKQFGNLEGALGGMGSHWR